MQRECVYKGHLQFYKMADIMLLLKNEALAYCVGEEEVWQWKKNGEKSCWPGLRQIDSSIDFPFTATVHPSLLWLHWPISEKKKKGKIAVYYGLNQNAPKENTLSAEQTNRVRWNITYSTQGEKGCVNLSVQGWSGRGRNNEFSHHAENQITFHRKSSCA